jgi:hypothetical protein
MTNIMLTGERLVLLVVINIALAETSPLHFVEGDTSIHVCIVRYATDVAVYYT